MLGMFEDQLKAIAKALGEQGREQEMIWEQD